MIITRKAKRPHVQIEEILVLCGVQSCLNMHYSIKGQTRQSARNDSSLDLFTSTKGVQEMGQTE